MKKITSILFLCASFVWGQAGMPYTTTPETDWDSFLIAWKPVLTWYTGIVERARVVNVAVPDVSQTYSVPYIISNVSFSITNYYIPATNTFTNRIVYTYQTINITNLLPYAYTQIVDGVSGMVTAFPFMTKELLTDLDAKQDSLYPYFVGNSVSNNDYMDVMGQAVDPNFLWVWLTDYPESRARVFVNNGIGIVTNVVTNGVAWITGGDSYWSAPFSGFSGGEGFRLGSLNCERLYEISNLPPLMGSTECNGVYRWVDSYVYDWLDYYDTDSQWFLGRYMLDGRSPSFVSYEWFDGPYPDIFGEEHLCGLDVLYGRVLIGTASYNWYWFGNPYFEDKYIYYGDNTTNGCVVYPYVSGVMSTNPVVSTNGLPIIITNYYGWNFRKGQSWSDVAVFNRVSYAAPANQWYVKNGRASLLALSATNNSFTGVTVSVKGMAFDTVLTNGLSIYPTSETATVTSTGSPVSLSAKFAGVSNITWVSGSDAQNGTTLTVLWTNRTMYMADASTWNTLNKKALEERITALKPLNMSAFSGSSYIKIVSNVTVTWQAATYYGGNYWSPVAAWEATVAQLTNAVITHNNSGTDQNYSYSWIKGTPYPYLPPYTHTNYFCQIYVQRSYSTYALTNYPVATNNPIKFGVDVLLNVHETPTNIDFQYTAPIEPNCDIVGFPALGMPWLFQSIGETNGCSVLLTLRDVDTNSISHGIDFPDYQPPIHFDAGLGTGYEFSGTEWGFYMPEMQYAVKWKFSY